MKLFSFLFKRICLKLRARELVCSLGNPDKNRGKENIGHILCIIYFLSIQCKTDQ